jgi:hypothetical protein
VSSIEQLGLLWRYVIQAGVAVEDLEDEQGDGKCVLVWFPETTTNRRACVIIGKVLLL